MNSTKSLFFLAIAAIFAVSSCSGLKTPCTTNCGGGGGNASLSLTISDTPPSNANVVSFSLPIIGITLTPSSGSAVSVFSSNPSSDFELTRLQTDTNLITNNVTVAAGTYTAVNVTVAAPSGVFINNTGSSLGSSCTNGMVCSLSGAAATISYTFPTALTLTANANQWLDLDFNYNNAVVTSSGALAIDVTQTGVMTATSTIPAGVASGSFANLDDFTGVVTAISSSSITVESSVRGTMTETINSSTQVFDPLSQCTNATTGLSCIQAGSIVSMQGVLTTAGAPTATSLDIIDISTTPSDEVEGIIYPSSCSGGYAMILSDSEIFTSGSPLASAGFGTGVCLTLNATGTFAVDSDYLTGQAGVPSGTSVAGFRSTTDILAGQLIRARISGAATTNSIIGATANVLTLRFSRLTGTISTTTSTSFTISGLPSYLGTSFSTAPVVQAYPNATLVEGQTSVGNLTGTVSMSSLYLNLNDGATNWFYAGKVRQQ
jgi:Domain of unknown function (DUF4382)